MKYRIAIWAGFGLLVVGCWQLYSVATTLPVVAEPKMWAFIRLTCPLLLAGPYFHFGVGIYSVLAANAAAYAVLGLILEGLSRTRFNAARHQ